MSHPGELLGWEDEDHAADALDRIRARVETEDMDGTRPQPKQRPRTLELTEPELMVLRCLSYGMTRSMAARTLGKGLDTVADQLKSARYKLRAKNTTHAVAQAIRRGLIS